MWLQVHGVEAWSTPSVAIRAAARQARLITSVSRHTRDSALRWCDIDPERVRVLPNTFDPRFGPGLPHEELRRHFGLEGRKVLLTVSRLASSERYKGQDRIIAAMPKILARRPDAIYLVVGDGDDRARLEALARRTGVEAHVRFSAEVSADALPDVYRLADAFAMPSTGEGFGIAFVEAAASGLPVVAGNCDGSVDALAEGALGALIDPGDSEQLVDAIVAALNRGTNDGSLAQRFAFANFAEHVDDIVKHRL